MENKILSAINGLNKRFDNLENRFDKLETRFDNLENRFDKLETRFDNLENRFDKLETRFDNLESQVKENTQILKALQHSSEVNKAEHENMKINIVKIQGDVSYIKNNLSTIEVVTANNYADLAKLKAVQ